MSAERVVLVERWGRTAYAEALTRQRALHEARKAGERADTLVLTEHEPVLTLGRSADRRHVLADDARLAAEGIALVPVERGGDVTYHGPGQLVAYPILDLTAHGRDLRRYVRLLEESALGLLAAYGLSGERRPGTPGVWLGQEKIASLGVFVSRWVTLHGIAINVNTDLRHFDLIEPCGLVGMRMTSVAQALGRPAPLGQAEEAYLRAFAAAFAVELLPGATDSAPPAGAVAEAHGRS
jgi:lipoate-protein ligase B